MTAAEASLVILPGDELAGDAVKGIAVGLFAVEILPVHADSPLHYLRNVTSTAKTSSTSRSRIAALLLPTALHQSKAEGQCVGVASGGPGRSDGYTDPVLEACKHRVRVRCLQQHAVLSIAGVHLVSFVCQNIEQQLAAGVVQQPVALGIIVIVRPGVDKHL